MEAVVSLLIPESAKVCAQWRSRLFVILSHPRSGSHWVRRMLGEIVALRNGLDGAPLGPGLDRVAGFFPMAINQPLWKGSDSPIFAGCHAIEAHTPDKIRVFLRRNFEDVCRSCRKAAKENPDPCFHGTRKEIYERWKAVTEYGCLHADLVLDYKMIQQSPAAAIRAICKIAGFDVTDEEVQRAVFAGKRENMLREQVGSRKDDLEIVNRENCYD